MTLLQAFSRRTLRLMLIFSVVLFSIFIAGYLVINGLAIDDTAAVVERMDWMVIGSAAIFFLFFGILQWLFIKNSLSNLILKMDSPPTPKKKAPEQGKKDTAEEKQKRDKKDTRIYLHLLSTLQREGRLIDFFSEDLSLYEDDQIGAAVRSIHENCKKTINKYIAPQPVLQAEEGAEIKVDPDFDPLEIKLTGNVIGEPPFNGILRHRGWMANKKIPVLSESTNPKILAPAEVEIV